MSALTKRLEAKLREYAAEAKTDAELARALLPWMLVACAEELGGEQLLKEIDLERSKLAGIPRRANAPAPAPCFRFTTCGASAVCEVVGRYIPVCEGHAKGATPFERRALTAQGAKR